MRRLYIEEMKRILRSRSTILFLAAALAVSVFLAWVPVTFERYKIGRASCRERVSA